MLAITANSTVASAITASGVTSLTFTATVAAGTNTYMVVEVADQNLGAGVSSVTYDGTALTSIGTESGNEVVALYGLKAPATGSYSVVVTFEASTYAAAGATTFNGVNQTTPTADFTGVSGNGKTSSIAATSAVNDLELDVTYWNSDPSGYSAGGSQTQQWEQSDSNLLGVSTTAAGAASVTMSSTVSTSENYQQAAVALQPAALTASTTTLSPSTTTPTYGTSVTFTATVTGSGGTPTGTVTFYDGGTSLGTGTLSSGSTTFTTSTLGVGSHSITADYGGDGSFNTSTSSAHTVTVSAASLTITADANSKNYGTAITLSNTAFTSSGLQNGQTIGSVTLTASGGTAASAAAGTYTITPSAATGGTFTASNYSITYDTGTLTVDKVTLTITAAANSKTYDGTTTAAATPTITSGSLVNGDTGTYSETYDDANVGTTHVLTPSAIITDQSDYTITYVTISTGVITARALTISATAQSKTYGQTLTFGAGSTLFTSSGLQNSETIGSVTLAVTNSGGAATAAAGGSYTITASAATGGSFTASNYSITYDTGTLTVNTAALTITASAAEQDLRADADLRAGSTLFTSSGLQNSETIGSVTLAVTNSGGAATAAAGGSYTITASAATGGTFTASNYNITYDTGTLTVNTAALTVTASAQSKTYGQTITFGSGSTQFTSSGLQNSQTIGSVTLAVSNNGGAATAAAGGSYTITASAATGGTFSASNYSITYDTGTLTVNTAALTITASARARPTGRR